MAARAASASPIPRRRTATCACCATGRRTRRRRRGGARRWPRSRRACWASSTESAAPGLRAAPHGELHHHGGRAHQLSPPAAGERRHPATAGAALRDQRVPVERLSPPPRAARQPGARRPRADRAVAGRSRGRAAIPAGRRRRTTSPSSTRSAASAPRSSCASACTTSRASCGRRRCPRSSRRSPTSVSARRCAWRCATCTRRLDLPSDPPTRGLTVLAMGKLGGEELNYHSDLDLIFVYEPGDAAWWRDRLSAARVLHARRAADHQRAPDADAGRRRVPHRHAAAPVGEPGAAGVVGRGVRGVSSHERRSSGSVRRSSRRAPSAGPPRSGRGSRRPSPASCTDTGSTPAEVAEVQRMRERIAAERGQGDAQRVNIKTDRGGLVDVEFVVQMLQLRHGHAEPARARARDAGGAGRARDGPHPGAGRRPGRWAKATTSCARSRGGCASSAISRSRRSTPIPRRCSAWRGVSATRATTPRPWRRCARTTPATAARSAPCTIGCSTTPRATPDRAPTAWFAFAASFGLPRGRCRRPSASGSMARSSRGTRRRCTCSPTRCTTASACSRASAATKAATALGDLPPARARRPAVRLGPRARSGDAVDARADRRGVPRHGAGQPAARVLHPPDRLPRRRRDGAGGAAADARRGRRVAMGRLPRRRRAAERRPPQDELVPALPSQHAAHQGEGGRATTSTRSWRRGRRAPAGTTRRCCSTSTATSRRRAARTSSSCPHGVVKTTPLPTVLGGITRDAVLRLLGRSRGADPRGALHARRGLPRRRGVLHRHRGRGDADPRARRSAHRRRAARAR